MRAWSLLLAGAMLVCAGPSGAGAASAPGAARLSDAPDTQALAQEAQAFANRMLSGEVAKLSDEEVVSLFERINPEIIASYLEVGAQSYDQYELWMRRQERLGGQWSSKPFLNYIKYRHQPRQVYMKWLDGGAKAGQEIIFDETRRKDAMYGHIGGLFNVVSVWTPMDGALARGNSNHTVADLGLQAICAILKSERALYQAEGRRPFPDSVEMGEVAGLRTVVLTWIAPSAKHYAYRTKVHLDLRQPVVRGIEAWDARGVQLERIFIEKMVPGKFKDADFDPLNKDYAF